MWYEVACKDEWHCRVGDLDLVVHESRHNLEWLWSVDVQGAWGSGWHIIRGGAAETKQDAQAAAENAARDFAQAILDAL